MRIQYIREVNKPRMAVGKMHQIRKVPEVLGEALLRSGSVVNLDAPPPKPVEVPKPRPVEKNPEPIKEPIKKPVQKITQKQSKKKNRSKKS